MVIVKLLGTRVLGASQFNRNTLFKGGRIAIGKKDHQSKAEERDQQFRVVVFGFHADNNLAALQHLHQVLFGTLDRLFSLQSVGNGDLFAIARKPDYDDICSNYR
jgi:hypothetical protein